MDRSSPVEVQQMLAVADRVGATLQYEELFEHAEDIILCTTLGGVILNVNRAVESILGWPREALVGQHCAVIFTPAAIALAQERIRRSLAGEKLPKRFEIEAQRQQGGRVILEGWARFIYDANRTPLAVQGIYRDVTEHRQMAESLQHYQTHLEHLVAQRTIELQKTQATLEQEIIERKRAEQIVCDYNRLLTQEVQKRTQELETKNAQLATTLSQLKDMQAQIIMQEKLASIGTLTAGIAHEMRNPLNFVSNFAELSLDFGMELCEELEKYYDLFDNESRANIDDIVSSINQNLQKIIEHGKRANRIVHGMLQYSRGQFGVRESTDLNALLGEYIMLAYHSQRAQDISFHVVISTDYDPLVGMIDIVPHDIGRVFLNLLNNAFYAIHSKRQTCTEEAFVPTLQIRTVNAGNAVMVSIRDNGCGIPQDIHDKIFQPFFTTKPAGLGTGLGLSISYDIIHREHQGRLEFQTQLHEYTEFIIHLPRKEVLSGKT